MILQGQFSHVELFFVLVKFEKLIIHAGALARRSCNSMDWKPFKRFPVLFAVPRNRAKAPVRIRSGKLKHYRILSHVFGKLPARDYTRIAIHAAHSTCESTHIQLISTHHLMERTFASRSWQVAGMIRSCRG
jgi:hypothetical protein